MLGIMRKYKQSVVIKIVFAVIVLSFIGTIFLVWGKGDKNLGPSGFAAKVNGSKISYDAFQKNYYRLRGIYEQIYGKSLDPEAEKQLGLKKMAIENLIESALVSSAAKEMGIKATDKEIQEAITAIPAFQKNGAFDFQLYQQLLKSQRITPKDFEDGLRDELVIKKARQSILAKASVSDDEALQAFRNQNDRVDLQFVAVSPAEMKGQFKLTDQELNSYLQAHPDEFRTAEQISLTYIHADPAKLSAGTTVSDEEIQTWYQKNIDRYQSKGAILPLAEVKDRAKADALKFKSGKKAYELAADAVNKNMKGGNLAAVSAALGTKTEETPLFSAKQPFAPLNGETELLRRAFLLKEGELTSPIETPQGIFILKLKERKPAAVPPLAQIRTQVEERAAAAKAAELAKKKAEDIQAQLAKGGSPGTTLQETGSFGYGAKGEIPRIGTSAGLMEAAFKLTTAAPAPATPFKIGDRWYAVKLKQRTEASTATFQAEKEKIKQTLLPKKQEEAMAKWLKELKDKAKIEINPALLAE